jgi:hypothetical protein
LSWAENYIDQLDPLTTTARNPDQWAEPRGYLYSDEATLKALLLRVTGFDGHLPRKLISSPLDDNDHDVSDDEC